MAENLQNIYSTTLASSYTAGAGSISVNAAPTAGNGTYTMSLVIRDQTTKAVKLIFRVTSVTGTTLTGAAETVPGDANANSGELVDGSMITVQFDIHTKRIDFAGYRQHSWAFCYPKRARWVRVQMDSLHQGETRRHIHRHSWLSGLQQ